MNVFFEKSWCNPNFEVIGATDIINENYTHNRAIHNRLSFRMSYSRFVYEISLN